MHFCKVFAILNKGTFCCRGDFLSNYEKQLVMATYKQFESAALQQDFSHLLQHGYYLLENDRLNNYAIEIMLEYPDVLPDIKPSPQSLVKNYQINYLEFVLYSMIDALVKQQHYDKAFVLIQTYKEASCEFIFEYVNDFGTDDEVYRLGAVVQQDIAYLVDGSPKFIRQSLAIWRTTYRDVASDYYDIADMTSKHLCNVMEVLFALEYFELLEYMVEVYKKYLFIDHYFEQLRCSIREILKHT